MRFPLLCIATALLAFLPPCRAMSKKQEIAVRIYAEANKNDSDTFAMPITLVYQQRQAYLSRIADLSEKQIDRVLPFPGKDGTWGCVFKLTAQGRLRLETMSSEIRGSAIVVFVITRAGRHQVVDMLVDRPVMDGIITIPHGLTTAEVELLKKNYKLIGEPAKQPWRDRMIEKREGGSGNRREKPADRDAIYDPAPADTQPRRRGGQDFTLPPLPRLQD